MITNEDKKYIRDNIGILTKRQIAKNRGLNVWQVWGYCRQLYALGVATRCERREWSEKHTEILLEVFAECVRADQKIDKITKLTGHTESAIRYRLRQLKLQGVEVVSRSPYKYADIANDVLKDYASKMKMKMLTEKYNLPDYVIRGILHKHGIYKYKK